MSIKQEVDVHKKAALLKGRSGQANLGNQELIFFAGLNLPGLTFAGKRLDT